jgi:hypothetical protein
LLRTSVFMAFQCLEFRDGNLGALGCRDRSAGEGRALVAENQPILA